MSQHDGNIVNASGAAVRADINSALGAIFSNHAGSSAPSPSFPHQWWMDESTNILRQRDAGNTAWVMMGVKDASGFRPRLVDGSTSTPALHYASSSNTGIRLSGIEQRAVSGGADVLALDIASNAATLAGTDTLHPVSPAGLASGLTLGNPGYLTLPGGFLLQWGSTVVTLSAAGNATVTFGVSFTSVVYNIVGWNGDVSTSAAASAVFGVYTGSLFNTSFAVAVRPNPGAISVRVNWGAFGR